MPEEIKPFEVTAELLKKLERQEIKMSSFSPSERKIVMDKLKALGEEENSEPPASETTEEPAEPPEPKPGEEKPASPEPPKEPDPKPLNYQEMLKAIQQDTQLEANEANKLEQARQKLLKQKERNEKAKKALEEAKKPAQQPSDHLSDDHQTLLVEQLAELRAEHNQLKKALEDRDQETIESLESEVNSAALERDYARIRGLQTEYPDLIGTKTPIEKLNASYADWLDGLVDKSGIKAQDEKRDQNTLRAAALKKWENSEELKKSYPTFEEQDKLTFLLSLHQQAGNGDLEGLFLKTMKKNGVLDKTFKREKSDAARAAAVATVAAFTRPDTDNLSPNDGKPNGGDLGGGLTDEKAEATIRKLKQKLDSGQRLTDADRKENMRALRFLSTSS